MLTCTPATSLIISQMADAELITRDDVCALVDAICANTHKLVRHQMTWFRDNSTYKVGCERGCEILQ